MRISLIIPLLNEEETLPDLWRRLCAVTAGLPSAAFEVVLVDDGSWDRTAEAIRSLAPTANMRWRAVRLSRNFGHQAALTAGMDHATGDALVFLDADLQDPPELLGAFLARFEEGYEVVYAIRQHRKEPVWQKICFSLFYRLFNSIAERPIPKDAGDFGLIGRRVADLIRSMPERDRLLRGLRSWVGFRQIGVPYDRPARAHGSSRYRFFRHVELALDGLFGYSKLPIRLSFFFGISVIIVCGIYLGISYFNAFVFGQTTIHGWRSLITLAFMLGGANLAATAIVGEYVCRTYFQAKGRPLYVVAELAAPEGAAPGAPSDKGGA
jgi:dolichol-phosphate mannosyltransferase